MPGPAWLGLGCSVDGGLSQGLQLRQGIGQGAGFVAGSGVQLRGLQAVEALL